MTDDDAPTKVLDSREGALLDCDGTADDIATNVELSNPYVLEATSVTLVG